MTVLQSFVNFTGQNVKVTLIAWQSCISANMYLSAVNA